MRVARLYGPRDVRVEEAAEPGEPGPGEALIRVTAMGICGSDLHYYREGALGGVSPTGPFILGHEFAACVEAVGPSEAAQAGQPVTASGPGTTPSAITPGMRVAVEPGRNCGRCESCQMGHPNLCPAVQFCATPPVEGCLRERMLYPTRFLFPLPPGIGDAEGAALEPLGIALHAVRLGKLSPGQTVAILGGGCIGLLLTQLCRAAGASQILVTEPVPHRREAAVRFGATDVLDPGRSNVGAAIRERTGGRGVDVALEAAGAPRTPAESVEAVKHGGRVVLVGIPADDRLELSHAAGRRKGVTLQFSRRMKHTYPTAIALVESGRIDLRGYVTHRFPLAEAATAFDVADTYRDGALKVVIDVCR
jgi:L-iditol 2-dehydrogenase